MHAHTQVFLSSIYLRGAKMPAGSFTSSRMGYQSRSALMVLSMCARVREISSIVRDMYSNNMYKQTTAHLPGAVSTSSEKLFLEREFVAGIVQLSMYKRLTTATLS